MRKEGFGIKSIATMNKARVWALLLLLLLCFCISNGNESESEERKKPSLRLRDAYCLCSALFHASIAQCCSMVKALVNHAYARFFPPNLDFRRGDEGEAVTERENGAGEKVREALARSLELETSKVTMEDAAKSAAKETIHKNEL